MGFLLNSDDTLEFRKEEFRKYFLNNNIDLPDRFGSREYAFVLFERKGMIRHIGFEKRNYFKDFIEEKTPSDIYYSSAYYQLPDAPTMQEKN